MAEVAFDQVSKVYPDGTRAVSGLTLDIEDGELMVLVGPSGCGKTTALRMVAGLEAISEGVIRIGERVVNHVPPRNRDIAMVFQSYALYPHLSVYQNIAFGLKVKKVPKEEIDRRVKDAAHTLGLTDFLGRKPRALSGGQRQRVAMGRAIVRHPQAFLMDEPLSNLDAKLRVQVRAEISKLQHDLDVTTIYVTHDQVEAMTMGDRVAVMRKGELQQVAPPEELYDHPVNLFVGGFIGSPAMNVLEARLERQNGDLRVVTGDQALTLDPRTLEARPQLAEYEGRDVVLGHPSGESRGRGARKRSTARPPAAWNGRAAGRTGVGDRGPPRRPSPSRNHRRRQGAGRGPRRGTGPDSRGRHDHDRGAFRPALACAGGKDGGGRRRHNRAALLRSRDGSRDLRPPTEGSGMTIIRVYAVAAAAIAAILVAASAAGGSAPKGHHAAKISGTVSIISEATGAEQEHFKNVLADFKKLYPDIDTKYTSAGRNLTTILSTAVAGGNPPDMALLPQPGFMRELVKKKALKPIEFMRSTIKRDWSPGWLALGSVGGKLYGLYLKGANKSTIWYNVKLFKNAGVKPPQTFPALLKAAKTLKASGTKAYSIGGGDGWTLTDLFENIYLRQAGGSLYDKLSAHKIKWTHPSVKKALKTMGQVFKDGGNIAGGTSGALTTVFADSVTQAFGANPKAAMVLEGDFVGGTITGSTSAKPGTDFNYFPWPAIRSGTRSNVVAGGDAVVMFRDKPATRALMKYFGTARAATVYAKQGGFSSPNKRVKGSAYHDPIGRRAALGLANAKVVRFDMSDLQPAAFGGTPGQGMWKLFQDLLKSPNDVNGIATKLEAAAKKAYGGK